MYSGPNLLKINQCRISLQVTFLLDIASVDGRRILLAYHNGKGHADSGRYTKLKWPPIGSLPPAYWKIWREFLERWCGSSLMLPRRLGRWYEKAEILTFVCYFLYGDKLVLCEKHHSYEFPPYAPKSRTRFRIHPIRFETHHLYSYDTIKAVDI